MVPGCSPSISIGSGSSASTVTTLPRRSSRRGCGRCFALVGLREDEGQVALRHVADQQHVEDAVIGLRVWAHHHSAAEEATVADHRVDHPPSARLVADRHAHLSGLPPEEHGEGGPVVRDLAAQRLRRFVGPLCDGAGDPRARDVCEVRARLDTRPRSIADDACIDLADCSLSRDVDGAVEVAWDVERAHEVPARAARDDGELDVAGADHAVDDLVHGPVAADDDQQRGALVDRFRGQCSELARPVRDERIAVEPACGRAMCDLGPPLPGRTAGGGRVDEEDRAPAASGRRDLPLPCRARSWSSARLPRGARRLRSGRTRPRRRCRSRSAGIPRARRAARRP